MVKIQNYIQKRKFRIGKRVKMARENGQKGPEQNGAVL